MKTEEARDDLDYQEDVNHLKRVWEEIKQPHGKTAKANLAKTQAGTQTKVAKPHPENKKHANKQSKTKVVLSEQNMKQTVRQAVRNPKPNSNLVIEVVTKPQKQSSDPIRQDRNISAPNHLVMCNPERQVTGDIEQLRKQINEKDYELSMLRVSNSHNEDRTKRLERELEDREKVIDDLKARERYLTSQLSQLNSKDFNFNYGKVQYENYRQDSRRLLKMLKTTSEYKTFADFALDDEGVRFLINANKSVKTKLDTPADQQHIHFCTCNKAFIPEAGLWVPEKIYDYGRDFIKDRKGEVSQTELELLLYDLNKLWREREKRILNHLNALKANQLGRYKRKVRGISSSQNRTAKNVKDQ